MKLMAYCLATAFLIMSPAAMAISWYQVEVIVFDRQNLDLASEQWQYEAFTSRNDRIELQTRDVVADQDDAVADQDLIPYMILDKNRHRLSNIHQKLQLSGQFRPLLHVAWQQPATGGSDARHVHLQNVDLSDVSDARLVHLQNVDQSDGDANATATESNFLDRIIDGSIKISSDSYLHVDVDLNYFKALPATNKILYTHDESFADTADKTVIKLKKSRRIKLREIHYFDHPMLGVILQVSRLY